MKKALERNDGGNQSDVFAEESIYKRFTSHQDSKLMIEFHQSNWEEKNKIKTRFKDERLERILLIF